MASRVTKFLAIIFATALLYGASGCAKPKVQLQVSRDQIQQGEDVRVSWTSKDAKEVNINGESVDRAGSKVFTPDNTTTYTAIARRGKKEARDSKIVGVTPRPAQPTISISADLDAIKKGQSTTLRWNSTNASQVTISDLGTVPNTGTRVVSPSQSTTYTATATGPGGTGTDSTRVTVTEETPATEGDRPRTTAPNPTIAALFGQSVQAVFFDYNRAELTPESRDRLRRAAAWLTQGPNRSILFRIEGNCDPRGTEEYNIGLGERRAQAAKEFLVSLGVEGARIQTVSYGEERASGTSEGSPGVRPSWAYDRRDDFVYVSGGTPPRSPEPVLMIELK
ncbi:MAG TPA: OmpA family protein [Blastocatellia bacterium]|nr:OmpA family protein [Blastocatellia bacterium]